MEVFELGIVKREPVDEFQMENSYLDQLMPYNDDVFDNSPVNWLSTLMEDSSVQSFDQLDHNIHYPDIVLNSLSHQDQTLNRLNGSNQRSMQEEISGSNFTSAPYVDSSSTISSEFGHRLETATHELDREIKSFYSHSQLYSQGLNPVETMVDLSNDDLKSSFKTELATASLTCEDDEGIRSSGDSSDRDSESGDRESHSEDVNYENLVLKSCEKGYDSGAHSPTSETPSTPPTCLMLSNVDNDGSGSSTGDASSPHDQTLNRQPFFLSDEEKRTLITEGLPIPAGYPLTKSEERALKKVRRKIKNKISAQESRRKKKEYLETLEKRVELCTGENLDLRKKLESMESANRTLISQLQKLQAIVASKVTRPTCVISTQTTESSPINPVLQQEEA